MKLFISSPVSPPNSEVRLAFLCVRAQSSSCAYYEALQILIMLIFLLGWPCFFPPKEKEGAPLGSSVSSDSQVLSSSILLV